MVRCIWTHNDTIRTTIKTTSTSQTYRGFTAPFYPIAFGRGSIRGYLRPTLSAKGQKQICTDSMQVCIDSLRLCRDAMQACTDSMQVCTGSMHVCTHSMQVGTGHGLICG